MPRCRAGLIVLLGLALGVATGTAQPNLLRTDLAAYRTSL
jgi:hypothetical protein